MGLVMVLLKGDNTEIEVSRSTFFGAIAGLGEVWVSFNDRYDGLKWFEYERSGSDLYLWIGRRAYVSICPYPKVNPLQAA